jgi:dTDP-4-dehydrorhamnose reductase
VRILLIGGSGQLGSDLRDAAAGRHVVIAPSHTELDITDRDAVRRLVAGYGPDVVIDSAAFHKVELCEADPIRAFAMNAVGALDVGAAAQAAGARCVFVSTDYVFDGTNADGYAEDDPARPLNVYGISKSAGELAVRTTCPDSLVVRGSGFFGHAGSSGKGGNFVETMLAKAAAGERISVVADQTFAPSSTHDMAERILLLLERNVPAGTYHAANAGSCSWFEFACAVFDLAGVRADVSPRPSGDQPVRRPAHSVLLDTRSENLGLPPNRDWRDALAWYLRERVRRRARIVDTSTGRRYDEPA